MKKFEYILRGLINAGGVFIYVAAISWLLFNGGNIFGNVSNFIMPLFMLLLFVISAVITGLLVLGKPIQLYFNNLKKEAIILLFTTLAWLLVFIIIVILILLIAQ